jgi:toxin ParE1/3/4
VVKWTEPAKTDLRQIHDYIAKNSRFYAKKVTLEIIEKSEQISAFPEAGRIVPEIGDPAFREFFIYSYRLIYEILNDTIEVLALIHAKRNFIKDVESEQQHKTN